MAVDSAGIYDLVECFYFIKRMHVNYHLIHSFFHLRYHDCVCFFWWHEWIVVGNKVDDNPLDRDDSEVSGSDNSSEDELDTDVLDDQDSLQDTDIDMTTPANNNDLALLWIYNFLSGCDLVGAT